MDGIRRVVKSRTNLALKVAVRQSDTIIFGFDSAWSDRSLGAICALAFDALGACAAGKSAQRS